jgi:hypothetical protein
MAGNWKNNPNDRRISTTVPEHWFDLIERWMASNLSQNASPSDAIRAILAKELGIPFPGETIKRNYPAEREKRAEAYIEAARELGSYKKVAEKFGKSVGAITHTIGRYERDQRTNEVRSQKLREQAKKPDPMW